MAQATPSRSEQKIKQGSVVGSSQTSPNGQKLLGSSPVRNGGQVQGGGQGGGQGQGGMQSEDRGGESQDPRWAVGQVQAEGRGGGQGQKGSQMYQPSVQMLSPSLSPQASVQQTSFQSASQCRWLGGAVGRGHPMTPLNTLTLAQSQVPSATSMQQGTTAMRAEEGQHGGLAQYGRRGRGRGRRGRGAVELDTSQSVPAISTVGTNQPAHIVSSGQPMTQVSQIVAGSKESVRKEGEGIAGSPSTSVAEIASTITHGLTSSDVLSVLQTMMTFVKENQFGDPITAQDKSEDSEGDRDMPDEINGEACVSSQMNEKKESDSGSFKRPLYDDQSRFCYETSERDSLSQSSSCEWKEQTRDNEEGDEGIFISEEIIARDFRQRQNGQSWGAAPIISDEMMFEDSDDHVARNQVSECHGSEIADSEVGSWMDVEDTDEISYGDADPYQPTRAIHSRGRGESHSRGSLPFNYPMLGIGRGRLYFKTQEVNPDMETLCRTKAVLDNSPNALGDRAQQSRTVQSVALTEDRKVRYDPQQQKDSNQNRYQSDIIKSSEITSTVANGLASQVPSSLENIMKNSILKENEIFDPITAKGRSKESEGDHVEISGQACVSSRMKARKEIDSRSVQWPLCDDGSYVYYETLERDSVSQSRSRILDGHKRDNEEDNKGIYNCEEIMPRSIGLSFIRQTQHVFGEEFRLCGALRGDQGSFRRRSVPQPSGQSWGAAPIRSDEMMFEDSDDHEARNQVSECRGSQMADSEVGSWMDVEDTDEISYGDANPYQKTRAIYARGHRESHSRGSLPFNYPMLGIGRGRLYFGTQEANPDVETLWRTKAVLGNGQNALGDRAQHRITAQSVALTEDRKVRSEPQQQKDSNQNRYQSDIIKSSEDNKDWKKTTNDTAVEGDFANSKSQPLFEVDQNLVIKYLVDHHNGSCTVFDVQKKSGIFPYILHVDEVLCSLCLCALIRVLIDPSDLDNSTVKVYMKKLQLCLEYSLARACSRNNCQYIHLCREFMMDCCFSRKCTLSHDVESEHNMEIMVECRIDNFSADQKLSLIRCSNLLVCSEHNSSEGCPVPNSCFKIHVCNSYIMNKCLIPGNKCPQGHDLFSERNMKILRLYDLDQLKLNFLLRMVVGFHDKPFSKGSSLRLRERHEAFAGRTKPARDSCSYSGREQVSGWGATEQKVMDTSASMDQIAESYKSERHSFTSNSQQKSYLPEFDGILREKCMAISSACEETQGAELSVKEQQKNVCKYFEEHTCDQMRGCTKRHGSQTSYLWRIRMDTEWFDLENNELIEEEFSNPAAEKFWGTMWDMTVCIDFLSLKSEVGAIQRLSTLSYAVCRDKMDATRWLWYWLDATGKWVLYGQDNEPPYQDVLEAKFLNDSRHVCCFEINGCNYELDFAKMEQRNLQTNFCRPIRRRPIYRNWDVMEMPSIEYHYDKSKIPFGWAPMDTESKHGMELVPLHLDDADYETIKFSFFVTLRATTFEIQRIYRLQNLDLWQSFQMKKVRMEKKTGDMVEEVQVYHGTPEEETTRWICSLGFDQRMHGRHGAKYGTGVYFATTAKFSHSYTQPSEKGLRYMFCARVLVGRTVEGKGEYRRPPPIDPTKPTKGLYDTCVDSIVKPSIYVVFDNNQSYPEYLVEYRDVAAVSEAQVYHQRSPFASSISHASQYSRSQFYGAPPSAAHPSHSASTSSPAYTSDFSACGRAGPNQFCGPPSSFMSTPGNYPGYASSSVSETWSCRSPYYGLKPPGPEDTRYSWCSSYRSFKPPGPEDTWFSSWRSPYCGLKPPGPDDTWSSSWRSAYCGLKPPGPEDTRSSWRSPYCGFKPPDPEYFLRKPKKWPYVLKRSAFMQ